MTQPQKPDITGLSKREFLAMLLFATSAPKFQNCDKEEKAKQAWEDADLFLSTRHD